MSRHKENSSVSIRECLSRISEISCSSNGPRVSQTVAEALKKELCPEAGIGNETSAKNSPRSLKIALAGESLVTGPSNPSSGRDWMFFRLESNGSGEIVASRAGLIYTLFCHIRENWLDAPASAFEAGELMPIRLSDLTARDDLLIGRAGFLKDRDQQVRFSDIEASMQEMARLGASRVIVNELATPFGQERGPVGEIYYRFYDYLPDLDQFVETKFNRGTYPPEVLEANLNSLKRLAALADRYGLIPGMEIANPRSVPESLLQRYPFLRGARIDHPYRSFEPRYTLTLAHPAVRWHYAELMRNVLKEVPELGFVTTLVNDSGAGFEYTASLYPGRNGGPYIIKEWMPDDVIAKAAAENVIRYYRLLRDAAHETHPDFRIITGLKNIAEESSIITAGIDNGIDLRMISQRIDVDTTEWKAQLQEVRQKGSDFVTHTTTRGTYYVLGVPSPWLTHKSLVRTYDDGYSKVDVTIDPPFLVSQSVNREVVRAFQLDSPGTIDEIIAGIALNFVGEESAATLLEIWKLSNRAVEAAPTHGQFGDIGFTWYRFWARPFVPDIGAIPEEDRRYYEKHILSHFNNPHNVDMAADMLWEIISPEEADRLLEIYGADVWEPLDQAIALAAGMVDQSPGTTGARKLFLETRDRLVAFRCFNITMRNLYAWIAGVHGYLKAEDEKEKQSRLTMVQEMVASELENAGALLELWENSVVDFMPVSAYGETVHDYGTNFGDVLRKKISLMETYGDRLPYIDPDYMWRMPEGSPLDPAEYLKY